MFRYSAVRLQGFKGKSTAEHNVLDYTMQQHRTFKALALAYCLLWNRLYITDFIKRVSVFASFFWVLFRLEVCSSCPQGLVDTLFHLVYPLV